jgi:diguanylate cyclase (GGDEF)-like protein
LFAYLRNIIYNPKSASLDLGKLPENFRNYGKGLMYFAECVSEAREFAIALSKGNLDAKSPSRGNEIAAPLKSLHAALKHLTWQTREVAKGDYKQRVSFMGDFADSFNSMIEQLYQNREALLQEIENGKKKSKALEESNNLLEAVTDQISQWIAVIDKNSGEWLYVNRAARYILKNPEWEPDLREWLDSRLAASPVKGSKQTEELAFPPSKATQYFSVVIHSIQWYGHEATAFVLTDISSEKKQLHRLESVAYRDTLTKTFNRRYGMEILTEWLSMGKSFVICFADLDNLKYVNDKFGHNEGDKYILQVADILRRFSGDSIVCRLGGDEFMILSQDMPTDKAEARLEELRSILLNAESGSIGLNIRSLSYGVIGVETDNTMSAGALLGLADEKMYEYKRAHKMMRRTTIAAIEKHGAEEARETAGI